MEVNKQCINFIAQSVIMVAVLNMLGLLAMRQWGFNIVNALAVSMMFVLVVDLTTILIWQWVIRKHRNMLPSFFTGVSGFRFLGALLVLLIGYLVWGRSEMSSFIVVFFVYYIASVAHHSIFFSRISNRV